MKKIEIINILLNMIKGEYDNNSALIGIMRIKLMRLDKNTLSYLAALIKEINEKSNSN